MMGHDIRHARIVEAMDEAFDSSAGLPWALSCAKGDGVGGLSIAEHGEDEFSIVGFEPMGSFDEPIARGDCSSSAEVCVLAECV